MLVAVMIFFECMKQALGVGDGECSSGSVDKAVDNESMLPWAILVVLGMLVFVAGWKLRGWVDNLMARLNPPAPAAVAEVPRPSVVQAEAGLSTAWSSAAAPTGQWTRSMATQSQTTYRGTGPNRDSHWLASSCRVPTRCE